MFSKFVFAFIAVFSFSSCGIKLQEKPRVKDTVELNNNIKTTSVDEVSELSGSDCFKASNDQIEKFFDGKATDAGIQGALNCYSKAVITFRDYVRGEKRGYYTSDEIRTFIQKNFLKNKKFVMTPALTEEIFKIKVLLVGGNRFGLTADELTLLSQKLKAIANDLVALNASMSIVSGMDEIKIERLGSDPDNLNFLVNLAQGHLRQFAMNFSRHFENPDYFYKKSELYNLIDEALKANQSSDKTINQVKQIKPLVLNALHVLTESELILGESDWNELLGFFADAYMVYRRYSLVSSDSAKAEGYHWLALKGGISSMQNTLSGLIQKKEAKGIQRTEIMSLLSDSKIVFESKDLFDSQSGLKWVNKILALSPGSQKMLFDVLWSHVLNKIENRLNGQATQEFDSVALETAVLELEHMFGTQFQLKRAFQAVLSRNGQVSKANLRHELKANGWIEVASVLDSAAVHIFNEKDYLKILSPDALSDDSFFSWDDIQKSNYTRVGARNVIRAFAKDIERASNTTYVIRDEVVAGWALVRPVMVELDLVDDDNTTFITSRFREADLFISSANGDSKAQYAEIHDLILHILSGLERADTIHIDHLKKCVDVTVDPELVNSKFPINEQCALDSLSAHADGFQALPVFLQFRSGLIKVEHDVYAMAMLKAAGYKPDRKQKDPKKRFIPYGDLKLFPHIVQYIEMIFFKYDLNRDLKFTLNEAELAWPVFKSTFDDMVVKMGQQETYPAEDQRKGLFMYLLHTGGACTTTAKDCNDEREAFIQDPQVRSRLDSDRVKLGKLFNLLADLLGSQ